jgi:trehalose 6-phosphate synthase
LAVALKSALEARGGLWFGWSGKTSSDGEPALEAQNFDNVNYAVTDLSCRDFDEYYNGFANRALWPICHYRLDLADLSGRDTAGYFRVNEQFSRRLTNLLRTDDFIWVHDYHFIPMGENLRQMGSVNRIGFFLHIPWPPFEIASALPDFERILQCFASYDLVGFQTPQDVENFSNCLVRAHAGQIDEDGFYEAFGRRFCVAAFPVGIDTETFSAEARIAEKNTTVKRTKASLEGRQLVIGVDRLDYSKGIRQRIDAFSYFIEHSPQEAKNRVTMLQITPKSRSDVPEYAEMQRQVAEQVGFVNGKLGDVDWTPIRYINKAIGRSALAGLYRIARVGLVTPLRDGMNLVAKEYVAAQPPENPGVLILSQFAGAAHELQRGALVVNPYDIEATAEAIAQAFAMPLAERKERWSIMMDTLRRNTTDHWLNRFIEALAGETLGGEPSANMLEAKATTPKPSAAERWFAGMPLWTSLGH